MKLSGFFSNTTASCTATAIVALACCPLVMSIRAHREANRVAAAKREVVPVRQSLPIGGKPSPWKSVSRSASPRQFRAAIEDSAQPVIGNQPYASNRTRQPNAEETNTSSPPNGSFAELQPPSTILVPIDPPAQTAPGTDSLDVIAFLPSQSVLSHPQYSRKRITPLQEERAEQSPVDPLTLIPPGRPSNWHGTNEPLTVIAQRAEQEIKRAFGLADKGAVFSARKQLETALQTIAHGLDAHHGVRAHSDCLACGLLALQEACDFLPVSGNARSRTSVAMTAAKHQSQILTESESEQLEAAEAMRRYYAYAHEHLLAATGGSPVASQAFYGLGKLAMSQGTQDITSQRAHNLNALALFQVAVQTNASNYLAANELGVLLAREGRLEDARSALQMSVAVQPVAEAWQNLIVVHERLGEYERSAQARLEWQRIAQSSSQQGVITTANGSAVHWVDKSTFERGVAPSAPFFGVPAGGGALR